MHGLLRRAIPRQQLIDPALLVAVDDGGKRGGQVGLRINSIEFAGLDQRSDGRPVLGSRVVPGKESFRPGQPGGRAATEALLQLVSVGDEVRVECYEPDVYGRFACHVFKGTVNLNLEQIKSGWGWLPSKAIWVRDPESKKAEDEAAKRGAWACLTRCRRMTGAGNAGMPASATAPKTGP